MAQSGGNAQYHQIAVKLGFIHLRVQTGDLWGNRCHPPKFIQLNDKWLTTATDHQELSETKFLACMGGQSASRALKCFLSYRTSENYIKKRT